MTPEWTRSGETGAWITHYRDASGRLRYAHARPSRAGWVLRILNGQLEKIREEKPRARLADCRATVKCRAR